MNGPEIERLIELLAKLPGLGPRSARRAALPLLKKREQLLMLPLARRAGRRRAGDPTCSVCGTLDTSDPCSICSDPRRDAAPDLRRRGGRRAVGHGAGRAFRGRYHVLGGLLSALDGVGPDALRVAALVRRVRTAACAR